MNCKPQNWKTNWSPKPGVLTPVQCHRGSKPLHSLPARPPHRRDATNRVHPRFLTGIYSHLGTTTGNENVCPSAGQVLLNMCFDLQPNCTRWFYHCLFLSFSAFISYPHQTWEHLRGLSHPNSTFLCSQIYNQATTPPHLASIYSPNSGSQRKRDFTKEFQ